MTGDRDDDRADRLEAAIRAAKNELARLDRGLEHYEPGSATYKAVQFCIGATLHLRKILDTALDAD